MKEQVNRQRLAIEEQANGRTYMTRNWSMKELARQWYAWVEELVDDLSGS
jgi:hypothetical protein